jgi:hypothetical protein
LGERECRGNYKLYVAETHKPLQNVAQGSLRNPDAPAYKLMIYGGALQFVVLVRPLLANDGDNPPP